MNKSITLNNTRYNSGYWHFRFLGGRETLIYVRAKKSKSYDLYQERDRQEKDGWNCFVVIYIYSRVIFITKTVVIRLSLFETGAWKQKWGEEHRPLSDPGLFLLWLFFQSLFLITCGQIRVISKSTVSWRCDKLSNYVVPSCTLLYFLKLCIGQICDSQVLEIHSLQVLFPPAVLSSF